MIGSAKQYSPRPLIKGGHNKEEDHEINEQTVGDGRNGIFYVGICHGQ
jgi:hypothetical protein